jgi:hypothetical protein
MKKSSLSRYPRRARNPRRASLGAFSLVELALALGVASFCLLAILGLLPVGLTNNQASIGQTAAASFTRSIISDLRLTPVALPATDQNSPLFRLSIPATGATTQTIFLREDGTAIGNPGMDAAASANPRYRATVTFNERGATRAATPVRILITWPALADPNAADPVPKRFASSYETFTSLDRN